ncbi:hypothetical protein G9A89_004725 [Geosiphon pyriformis]|nr:hypothetical protein G9A89_004725 [Geosiphon pyriformis]
MAIDEILTFIALTSIFTKINKKIEHYTQQRYPITYANKDKRKLQTPVITPQRIQPPIWKKTRIESTTNSSYHYTPGSIINILLAVIVINPLPVATLQQLSPQQQPNLDPIIYAPITKLKKFTSEKDNTQINNNSINRLANTFTTIKQGENKAVTTYLECFHRNLHQIQAIQTNYFTAPQILNQFIRGLCSSILQHIYLMHLADFQAAVTNARNFEAAEFKANHVQAVNLVINRLSDLDSKLKQFSESINQKLEGYLANNNQAIYQPFQQCNNQENFNHTQNQPHLASATNYQWQQKMHVCYYCAIILISSISVSNINLSTNNTHNLSTTTATNNLLDISNLNLKLSSYNIKKFQTQSYLKLEIGNGCSPTDSQLLKPVIEIMPAEFRNWVYSKPKFPELFKSLEPNQKQLFTSNILLAIITNNNLLVAIFLFKLEELTFTLLFSRAALEKKPITAIYTDVKVNGHSIKFILNSYQVNCATSTRIITANRATKTSIGEINDFLFEVNGIIIPIKVLVIEATQYQAFVRNNWLSKTNAVLD